MKDLAYAQVAKVRRLSLCGLAGAALSSRLSSRLSAYLNACLCVCLSACSLAPAYHRPEVADPGAFKELPAGWKVAEPADDQPKGAWWTAFGDPVLNGLQERVRVGNQNLKAALARYEQARAIAEAARAPTLPALTLGSSATRSRGSDNSPRHVAGRSAISNDLVLGLNLTYEVDLWGRVRNAAEAGDARAQASAADLEALGLSLRAEVASDYFALRGYERSQQVLSQTLASYAQALELTQRRHAGGLVTELDVNQARVQVENTRSALTDLKLKAAQMTHALALLTGEAASRFSLPAGIADGASTGASMDASAPASTRGAQPASTASATRAQSTLPPPEVPPGQPASLLERRPDVAAAERRVQAANADIGVARAGYFPTLSLGTGLGLESARSASWLEAPSRFWSIGPQALLTVFDGERVHANVKLARAVWDEAAANYRQTVLNAYREAEDSLAAIGQLHEESLSQQAAEDAALKTYDQARRQYEGGLITYLPVSTAQAALAQAQQAGINLQVAQQVARVQLIKALGGGWHSPSRP